MSDQRLISHFYRIRGYPPTTDQVLINAKILLIHRAEQYLAEMEENRWTRIRDIDPVIRKEVVEILTQGRLWISRKQGPKEYRQRYLRVIENEDWSEFKLVETLENYGTKCEQAEKAVGASKEGVQQDAGTGPVQSDHVLQITGLEKGPTGTFTGASLLHHV